MIVTICKMYEFGDDLMARHGHRKNNSRTKTYNTWRAMRYRCNNKNHKSYGDYGGRGIKICERWDKFPNFLEDMGERPAGMSLDRIDNNGNYELSNCRWALHVDQCKNRKR